MSKVYANGVTLHIKIKCRKDFSNYQIVLPWQLKRKQKMD